MYAMMHALMQHKGMLTGLPLHVHACSEVDVFEINADYGSCSATTYV